MLAAAAAVLLYLIVFLHQTTTQYRREKNPSHCILSSFYIKPQPWLNISLGLSYCILSSFYIKPQLSTDVSKSSGHCILSSFYIKPQLSLPPQFKIENCILSSFYIKPQPSNPHIRRPYYCILSSFYIKPQLNTITKYYKIIVSYRLSTSNHNCLLGQSTEGRLYLIVFLHQTTTSNTLLTNSFDCILSSFYIKPQRNAYKHLIIKHLKRYSITKSEMMSSFLLQIY